MASELEKAVTDLLTRVVDGGSCDTGSGYIYGEKAEPGIVRGIIPCGANLVFEINNGGDTADYHLCNRHADMVLKLITGRK